MFYFVSLVSLCTSVLRHPAVFNTAESVIIIIIIIMLSMSSSLLKFGVASKIVNNEDIHILIIERALIQSLLTEGFVHRITNFVFPKIVCHTSWTDLADIVVVLLVSNTSIYFK